MTTLQYFGTDGIRGKVGYAPLTADFALKLAHCVGAQLKESNPKPVVAIGKDTRISGYMFESALEAGFNSVGVDVILLGPLPTPAIAYLTKTFRIDLGVVISASHNPFDDNGIKFFSATGHKLPDQWELDIEKRLQSNPQWLTSKQLGKTTRSDSANGRYIEFCKASIAQNISLKGLKIVIDSANGAAYKVAPKIFFELGAQVISVASTPDGININAQVGATNPQFIVQQVLKHQADFGIALDGDADRLLMVDSTGRIYSGDELIYILAQHLINTKQQLPGIVGTVMTNMAIENAFTAQNIEFVRAKVGDRYVMEELEKRNWFLGGENSGHILDLRKHTTGDGIISALQVLQACLQSQQSLAQFTAKIKLFPQTTINLNLKPNYQWQQDQQLNQQIELYRKQLNNNGRILIRKSGTEPLIRVMVEAKQEDICQQLAQQLANIIQQNQT